VIDPEIGCNVVDLGLIYNLDIREGLVTVKMTLTTPGCPVGESMAQGVEWAVMGVPGVQGAEVEIVWDPPWHPAMMTDEGKAMLGANQV